VPVTLIKPGPLDTAMAFGRSGARSLADPQACALASWRAAAKGRHTLYFPWRWGPIMAVVRAMPEFIFKRLNF
jgi:short-subunit dehydrogenase